MLEERFLFVIMSPNFMLKVAEKSFVCDFETMANHSFVILKLWRLLFGITVVCMV